MVDIRQVNFSCPGEAEKSGLQQINIKSNQANVFCYAAKAAMVKRRSPN